MIIVRFKWNEPAFGSREPSTRYSTRTGLGYRDIQYMCWWSVWYSQDKTLMLASTKIFALINLRNLIGSFSRPTWGELAGVKEIVLGTGEMRRGGNLWDEEGLDTCAYLNIDTFESESKTTIRAQRARGSKGREDPGCVEKDTPKTTCFKSRRLSRSSSQPFPCPVVPLQPQSTGSEASSIQQKVSKMQPIVWHSIFSKDDIWMLENGQLEEEDMGRWKLVLQNSAKNIKILFSKNIKSPQQSNLQKNVIIICHKHCKNCKCCIVSLHYGSGSM